MDETHAPAPGGERQPIIALCEDDAEIRGLLANFLGGEGFSVRAAADGVQLEQLLEAGPVDLIILDWMLPGEDGLSICRRLTTHGAPPIIMLTARDSDGERVEGLETGADAYVAKPFSTRVLLAHVRAALRQRPGADAAADRLVVADLLIDAGARRVLKDGAELPLTAGEFDLLLCFATRPQRVLSRDTLMELTRGRAPGLFDRTIDVQVSRLRRRLDDAGSRAGTLIRAVRNAGYILAAPTTPDC